MLLTKEVRHLQCPKTKAKPLTKEIRDSKLGFLSHPKKTMTLPE